MEENGHILWDTWDLDTPISIRDHDGMVSQKVCRHCGARGDALRGEECEQDPLVLLFESIMKKPKA